MQLLDETHLARPAALPRRNRFAMPFWKRAMDILVGLLVLPFLAVATLIMTLIMKLTSPGPVFFRQERIGFRGQKFMIYKFRTMHVNHDPKQHQDYFRSLVDTNAPMAKLDHRDSKSLVPGARWMRAAGIDELPQILNILSGDMTLVGPRPCLPLEYDLYLPWQRERFHALPGVTGLWQVSGKNRTTFEDMIHFDIQYVRTKSMWLDVKIILLTPPALVTQIADSRKNPSLPKSHQHTEIPFPQSRDRARARADSR